MTVYSRNPRVHIYERGAASIQANYDPHTKLSSQVSYAPCDLISYSLGHKFFKATSQKVIPESQITKHSTTWIILRSFVEGMPMHPVGQQHPKIATRDGHVLITVNAVKGRPPRGRFTALAVVCHLRGRFCRRPV